jgi:UDP-GlcNAc:undecaprenyl-phosphate GlcNAc-1-phosphate transferase
MGFSEKSAVLFLYGIGAVSGIAGIVVSQKRHHDLTGGDYSDHSGHRPSWAFIWRNCGFIRKKNFPPCVGRKFTPVLIELTYKRQMMMVILDFGLVAFSYYLSLPPEI